MAARKKNAKSKPQLLRREQPSEELELEQEQAIKCICTGAEKAKLRKV